MKPRTIGVAIACAAMTLVMARMLAAPAPSTSRPEPHALVGRAGPTEARTVLEIAPAAEPPSDDVDQRCSLDTTWSMPPVQ
jgi:hypothetical protein